MNFIAWAIKWDISLEAIEDLQKEIGTINTTVVAQDGESESAIQARIRLEGSGKGILLMRNNVGVLKNKDGIPVRYGLANDSAAINKKIKSSDLIGINPILIKQHHVGSILGQFISREVKSEKWRYSGNENEMAQLKFMEIIISHGGDAAFTTRVGTL